MLKISQIISDARIEQGISVEDLESVTKIKASFIKALESEDWEKLPEFPIVLGFVKNLASSLGVDEKKATAILKRDYPPKKLSINPKPDVYTNKQILGPKTVFALGILFFTLIVGGYLLFQYIRFVSPPLLSVVSPIDGQTVLGNEALVFGSTQLDAKVTVDNQPVLVDDNGKFSVNIPVSSDTNQIVVTAQSRSGKTTIISRKINVQK